MFSKTTFTFASLLAAASALSITSPTTGDKWDLSQDNTIKWTSVATDPSTLIISLVSTADGKQSTYAVSSNVNTADGKYDLGTHLVVTPATNFQVYISTNSTTNTGSIAQSSQFEVTKSGVAATTTTSSSGPSQTSAAPASTSTKPNAGVSMKASLGLVGAGALAAAYALL